MSRVCKAGKSLVLAVNKMDALESREERRIYMDTLHEALVRHAHTCMHTHAHTHKHADTRLRSHSSRQNAVTRKGLRTPTHVRWIDV